MQVINRTRMPAELHVAADRETRDHFVLVVKGTFLIDRHGNARLSPEPQPFKYADEHFGDPATTSIRYECDFVLRKPATDVLLVGHAYAPDGREATQVDVSVRVASMTKRIRVFGDRVWEVGVMGYYPSAPAPFTQMPLIYERAFGGPDATARDPQVHGAEMRNLIGVGFRVNSDPNVILGSPLPNLEDPNDLIRSWKDRPRPMAFGCLGRGWQPRIKFAGTYDQKWIDERYPFLPFDFDERYFQSAPVEQQLPSLTGGEEVECTNVTNDGRWTFYLPKIDFLVAFIFRKHHVEMTPRVEGVLLEPDHRRVVITWRASAPVRTKLHDLQQVFVGEATAAHRRALQEGKRIFQSLESYMAWRKRNLLAR